MTGNVILDAALEVHKTGSIKEPDVTCCDVCAASQCDGTDPDCAACKPQPNFTHCACCECEERYNLPSPYPKMETFKY